MNTSAGWGGAIGATLGLVAGAIAASAIEGKSMKHKGAAAWTVGLSTVAGAFIGAAVAPVPLAPPAAAALPPPPPPPVAVPAALPTASTPTAPTAGTMMGPSSLLGRLLRAPAL